MERESRSPTMELPKPLSADEAFFSRLETINLAEMYQKWIANRYQEGNLTIDDLNQPQKLILMQEREPVSQHETAHEFVARSLGWNVTSVTIVPKGNVLGATYMTPRSGKSTQEIISDFITISLASYVGEEMFGNHDHRGCGSDLAKAKYFARFYNHFFCNENSSDSQILSTSFSKASSILSGKHNSMHQNSINLLKKAA
jgi:hypothetical protein